MNHIARLQLDLNAVNVERDALVEGVRELMAYCSSGKFSEEPYVNVSDILSRCRWLLHDAGSKRQEFENEEFIKSQAPRPRAFIAWNEDDRMYHAYDDNDVELGKSHSFMSLRRSLIGKGFQTHS